MIEETGYLLRDDESMLKKNKKHELQYNKNLRSQTQ